MDKRQVPELTKITFDTSQANDLQAALADVSKDMNTFSRVVSSATNTMEYWQSNMKKIVTEPGTNQGYFQQSVYVNKADAPNVMAALQASNAKQFGGNNPYASHSWMYDIEARDANIVQGNINNLVGKEAFKLAQAEAKALGGDIWRSPTNKFPNRVTYFYPADNAEDIIHSGAKKTAPFKGAKSLSSAEQKRLDEIEAINREKEQAREAARITKEEEANKKARQKEIDKANKMLEAQKKKQEQEELKAKKQEETEERKKEREKEKSQAENNRTINANVKTILGLATVAVSLLRKLVVSSLQAATNLQKQSVTAHNLGMSYTDIRDFSNFDKAHGLPEGTSLGALQSIQGSFGNLTNLDENAIATLARVMGSEVVDLINSGIGGKDPKALLEMILDKYFKQFKEGKNSLGMEVGQDEARRELYTSLSTISTDLANLFAQMTEDYGSFSLGGFDNFAEWKDSVKIFGGKLDEANEVYTKEIAEKYNKVIASFDNLQTNFLTKLSQSLEGILTFLSNFRLGLSASEKYQLDIVNKEKNEKNRRALEIGMAGNEEGAKRAIKEIYEGKKFSSLTFEHDLPKEQENFSSLLLMKYAAGGEKSIMDYFGVKKALDIAGWTERADAILTLIGAGEGEFSDEFLTYAIEYEKMQEFEKEGEKKPGEKINLINYDPAEEAVKVKNLRHLYAKLFNLPKHWETLTSGIQGNLFPFITPKLNEILSNPEEAGKLYDAIINDYTRDKNSLAYKVLNNKQFENDLYGVTQGKSLLDAINKNDPGTKQKLQKIIYDHVRKHPELAYQYGLTNAERESLVGMAIENLDTNSLNNYGLGWIAVNNLPSEINTALPYNMNWQSGFDKDGKATLTINFEQEGNIFGSATVMNPAFASSSQSAGTLVFNNNQIILKNSASQ